MGNKYYQGQYRVTNRDKYIGNPDNVIYRSMIEFQTFRWCDRNDQIIRWGSEEVVIKYICETDRKQHRYYIDLYIQFKDKSELLVEIKPERFTKPPVVKKGSHRKRHLRESLQYVKNRSKWKWAKAWAEKHNMKFEIWTEKTLKSLGVIKWL